MQAVTFVELDIPVCSLTYGVPPCMAELGVTGDHKCFNTIATCQDRGHYTETLVTLRFAMEADYLVETGIEALPTIQSVDFNSAKISLGEDLGVRASLEVTFRDHKWSDTGPAQDPYVAERAYDPYKQGTYWGKFAARHQFLRGRAIRLIRGFVGQELEDMDTRHYVIESTDGPTAGGQFTVIAKDPLKLADGDRSQAPAISNGYLVAPITAAASSATLTPAGIGDAEYPASGYVAIGGKEIVQYTRVGDVLTLNMTGGRGKFNTTAVAHEGQDRVQVCLYYEAQDPADIVYDLLGNYANFDSAELPLLEWLEETETFLRQVYTGIIAEPTPVNKLVSELVEQAALSIWWDDRFQQVRLQVLRQIPTDVASWSDETILESTFSKRDQPKKRVSQVWVYYGQINPLEGQNDPSNYRSTEITIDTEAEEDNGSPAYKKIYSRWIPPFGRPIATRLGNILLGRYSRAPRTFNFELFVNESPELGIGYVLSAVAIQDAFGERELVPIQITSLERKEDRWVISAEEMRGLVFDEADLADRVIIIDGNAYNLDLRAVHDTLYPALRPGDSVTFIINANVRIGSVSTGLAAINVGDWPPELVPLIINHGRLQGAGGRGGSGKGGDNNTGGTGGSGGPAFYTRVPCRLSGSGKIYGGGGGGGGGGGDWQGLFGPQLNGGGGGGGAGDYPGGGGNGVAEDGRAGSLDAGGRYGDSSGSSSAHGGYGGAPGSGGSNASGIFAGSGGPAGRSIDGWSYVIEDDVTIDYKGPKVN